MKTLGWVALIITVIGAINWGLIGLFSFNLVSWLFVETLGQLWLAKATYIVVGIAGVITLLTRVMKT